MDDQYGVTGLQEYRPLEPPPYTDPSIIGSYTAPTRLVSHTEPLIPEESPDVVDIPTSARRRSRRQNPFRQPKSLPSVANRSLSTSLIAPSSSTAPNRNQSSRALLARIIPRNASTTSRTASITQPQAEHVPSNNRAADATDEDTIFASLNAALNLQRSWEDEIRKNEATARAAQDQIRRLERQAREESARLRHEEQERRIAEQRRAEAERRARLAKEADCSVCSESLLKEAMCHLPCKHYYCRTCLAQSIATALKSRKPFRCCKREPPNEALAPYLPSDLSSAYTSLADELSTPNPTYCSTPSCSTFIPRSSYTGDTATCPRCRAQTCRLCKSPYHPGVVCREDKAGQALIALGAKKKWTRCPRCGTMVERKSGCLHMSCACGMGFCYNCGRGSGECGGEGCRRR
jgi:hypothetical protein